MNKKSKQVTWWAIAGAIFIFFVLLQVPANWIIAKFYKNNSTLHNISGNIWQGQADWQKGDLSGSVKWTTRPLDLLLLRVGADLEIQTGKTQIQTVMAYGLGKKIIIRDLNGQISPESLKTLSDWQWPANLIQLSDVNLNFNKEQGFSQAQGQLQWAGGDLVYVFSQRQERMTVPSLSAVISDEAGKLNLNIQDQRQQKMANINLDAQMMLDVQLTQRLLMNVPSYDGKAGMDSYVITTRQPLLSGGL